MGEGGGFEKRTGLYFPILFVKGFGDLKDEGGGGFQKGQILEDVLCERSLSGANVLNFFFWPQFLF